MAPKTYNLLDEFINIPISQNALTYKLDTKIYVFSIIASQKYFCYLSPRKVDFDWGMQRFEKKKKTTLQ